MKSALDDRTLEQILEEKRKNIELIFDVVPVGMLLIDEELNVTRVNNAVRNMFGKDFIDIINKQIGVALNCINSQNGTESCHGGKCGKCIFTQYIKSVFDTNTEVLDKELQYNFNLDGQDNTIWISLTAKPASIDNRNYAVVAMNDITERKIAEEQLNKSIQIKSQFISTVSHELRTPLVCINEGIEMVLEGLAGRLKKKQRELLTIAHRNVKRLSELINEVLDFQKLQAGNIKLNAEIADIAPTVKDAYETMLLFANKQSINLSLEIEKELPPISFDRNKITQVLTNLLNNAVKFTPPKGRIDLKVVKSKNNIEISVSDTGMGIPKEDISKIFEQFYRVHRPGVEIKGTGLGLAIVHRIVKLHRGYIKVTSELNKGTTFTVYLPIN